MLPQSSIKEGSELCATRLFPQHRRDLPSTAVQGAYDDAGQHIAWPRGQATVMAGN